VLTDVSDGWVAIHAQEEVGSLGGGMQRVSMVKEEFGGTIVKGYDFQQAVSSRGGLTLWIRQVLWRWRPGTNLIAVLAIGGSE
jgi:hypothetical protein